MIPNWLHQLSRQLGASRTRRRRTTSLKSRLLMLEDRITPALMYALDTANGLFSFDSATPGTVTTPVAVTGLQAGEVLQGLDSRPATGQLFGLGITDDGTARTGRIYTINPTTAVATQVGAAPFSTTLSDTNFWGFDFNPVVDRIRIISSNGENLRVNPNDGTLAGTDTNLSITGIDAVAYDRNFSGTKTTTLYTYNFASDQLATIGGINGNPSPNGGVVNNVGASGFIATGTQQFDIESGSNIARLVTATSGNPNQSLYTIDLATGAATLVGAVGAGAAIRGLTSAIPQGARMYGVTTANVLLTFGSAAPDIITSSVPITGLQTGENILGVDVRPATLELYGLGVTDDGATRTGRIYRVDPFTGVATAVGLPFSAALSDVDFWGFDFNPVVDRIRITNRNQLNLRVNPNNGALAATDTNLSASGINDVAYDRNGGFSSVTTLYGYNFDQDKLVTIGGIDGVPSPNGGVVTPIGSTGIVALDAVYFDIDAGTGTGRFSANGNLYTINLSTGVATLVGGIGGSPTLRGMTTASSSLAVAGTAGNDALVVTATDANSGSYTLNGGPAVPFAGISSFSFLGSTGDDTLTINHPAVGTFAPAGGIYYDGQGDNDTLSITTGTTNWSITGPNQGSLPGVTFLNVESLAGGSGVDNFTVAAGGSLAGTIDGGAGVNTLTGPDAVATWNITGPDAGNIAGVVNAFLNIQNLTGGSQADSFAFANGGGVAGLVDGGAGTDGLDYSAVTTGVHANLGISINAAASIDGGQEVSPTSSPATGTASLTYNASTGLFDITVSINGVVGDTLQGFHIHAASAGVNGGIIVDLLTAPGAAFSLVGGTFSYSAIGVSLPGLNEAAFLGDNTYLNLHTNAFPTGEVRGQIVRQTQLSATPGLATGTASIVNLENVTGGAGNDSLVGNFLGNVLTGGGGNDTLLGGPGADTFVGGDGDDLMIWANGDGSDIMDGGADSDTVQVNGSVTAGDGFLIAPGAGGRLNFQRTNFGPFSLDIGTTETLTINGNNFADAFTVNDLTGVLDLGTINLQGNADDDTFNVTPSATVTMNVDGDTPVPPATPGDTLNVLTAGTTDPLLSSTSTAFGLQGNYTFADRQPVNFRDVETLSPNGSDLAITITDGQTSATPGTLVTFTVVVSNNGPLAVSGAGVATTLPATLTGVTFTAVQAGGASGFTANGTGSINDIVDMPIGSTITYTVSGTIDPAATGTLTVSADVISPAGQTDPDTTNNTASDVNTLTPLADLVVTKSDSPDPVFLGAHITYTITLTNTGPSDAQTVQLTDVLPAHTTFVSFTPAAGWTTTTPIVGATGTVTASRATLTSGDGAQVFTLVVRVDTNTAKNTIISNTTDAETATTDATPADNSATANTTAIPYPLPMVVGADAGTGPQVKVYNAFTGDLQFSFNAYDVSFTHGVRVAAGDVNGDGIPDIITAPGAGGGPQIRMFDGATLADLGSFFAYDSSFRGGVYVAAGDTDGDGRADVVTGAGANGGPHVKVFSGANGAVLQGFFAYDPSYRGGVRVAAGDVDGDGNADVVTGPGTNSGPQVKVFSGVNGVAIQSFFAYASTFTGGIFVAAGDLNNDGNADIITGPDAGGGPQVKVFSGADNSTLTSFFAYDSSFRGGVRTSVADVNSDNQLDILTGPGPVGGPHVKAFDGLTQATLVSFFAFDPAFRGGVFVG